MATVRAMFAVLLLIGFYGVALLQLVAVGGFAIWLGTIIPGAIALKLTWPLFAAVVGAVGLALWRAIRNKPEPPEGLPLSPREAPYLWDVVEHLARSVGTRAPDEIRLVPDVNAAVVEHSTMLGLVSGRRFLYLGVPLVQGMTIAQIYAVLAHELGHYSHSHTRLGAVAYRGRIAITGTLARIGRRNPVRWVFHAYALLYLLVDHAVVRRQELEADRMAVQVAGREATAAALREIPVLDAAWGFYFTRYVKPSWDAGFVPDELFDGFRYLLSERQDELRKLRMSVPDGESSRWDTHPPIQERIAGIAKAPVSGAVVDDRPAALLLPNLAGHCRQLQAAVIDHGGRTVVPWSELRTLTARIAAEERASEVLGAMGRAVPDAAPLGLEGVLRLVAEGRLGELAGPLFPEATRRELPERLAALLVPLLELAAVRSRVATWRHSWSGPAELVGPDGQAFDLTELARLATNPESVRQAWQWLSHLGIDITSVRAETSDRGRSSGDGVLAGLANIKVSKEPYDLLVLDYGLVLLADPGPFDEGKERLRKLVASTDSAEIAKRNWFIPYAEIVGTRITKGIPLHAELRLADGRTVSLKEPWTTQNLTEDSRDVLRRALESVAR